MWPSGLGVFGVKLYHIAESGKVIREMLNDTLPLGPDTLFGLVLVQNVGATDRSDQ
jgi:hypothetical protein